MLTDKTLRAWRPTDTAPAKRDITQTDPKTGEKIVKIKAGTPIPVRKIADSNGLYAVISDAGTVSFRYDYRLDGRRETLTIGRYEPGTSNRSEEELDSLAYGATVSLKDARVLRDRASRQVEAGSSPSRSKVESRVEIAEADTFGAWVKRYFEFKSDPKSGEEQLAESTLELRRSVPVEQDIELARLLDGTSDSTAAARLWAQIAQGKAGVGETLLWAQEVARRVVAGVVDGPDKDAAPAALRALGFYGPVDKYRAARQCMETIAAFSVIDEQGDLTEQRRIPASKWLKILRAQRHLLDVDDKTAINHINAWRRELGIP